VLAISQNRKHKNKKLKNIKIMKKLNLDELKNENQGKDLFAMPDNYFDTLPSKIQNKIQGRKNQKSSFALFSQIYPKIYQSLAFRVVSPVLACGLLLFVGLHFYQENDDKTIENNHVAALNGVTENAIQEYLLLSNVGEDEIIQVCVANGEELHIDGLPAEISQEILEGELDIEDYL
jgi:hypothetical protein